MLIVTIYLTFHLLLGILLGYLIIYLYQINTKYGSKLKAWIAYVCGMAVTLLISGLIGEINVRHLVTGEIKWVSIAILFFGFIAGLYLGRKTSRQTSPLTTPSSGTR